MLIDKTELPNLNIETKKLIFRGTVSLYKLDNEYYVVFKDNLIFKLDSTGKFIDILKTLDIKQTTQIFFLNTFENSINIDISFD